jgi:hypothetical protein
VTEPERYPTAKGVEDAIKAAARRASAADPSLTTDQRIRLEHFNRFLSRVFSEGPDSEWLLKGGTGMLARVPSTRATLDIDLYLYREGYGLDDAVADLRRLAGHELGDHFRFVYVGHRAIVGGEGQPYTDGYRVEFDTYIGAQKKARIGVDLATGAGLTAEPTVTAPASALDLPRLVGFDYRLYPVVDQIADKVCATMHRYGDRPSSREKDLVDLVVLAVTHDIDGTALSMAIATETRRRRMDPIERFVVPAEWGAAYSKMARTVPYCADVLRIDAASDLVAALIDPALDDTADGLTWHHAELAWSPAPASPG